MQIELLFLREENEQASIKKKATKLETYISFDLKHMFHRSINSLACELHETREWEFK